MRWRGVGGAGVGVAGIGAGVGVALARRRGVGMVGIARADVGVAWQMLARMHWHGRHWCADIGMAW